MHFRLVRTVLAYRAEKFLVSHTIYTFTMCLTAINLAVCASERVLLPHFTEWHGVRVMAELESVRNLGFSQRQKIVPCKTGKDADLCDRIRTIDAIRWILFLDCKKCLCSLHAGLLHTFFTTQILLCIHLEFFQFFNLFILLSF